MLISFQLKRKIGVRGTGGSTPAPAAMKRRESSMFATPTVIRPPSALSDASNKEKREAPAATTRGLTKTTRTNVTAAPTAVKATRVEGSMGPPPTRTVRAPVSATSARLARSPSGTPPTAVSTVSGRPMSVVGRPSSVVSRRASMDLSSATTTARTKPSAAAKGSSPVLSERDEKENSKPTPKPTSRRVSVPA